MKKGIHPTLNELEVSCVCGMSFTTRSTLEGPRLQVDICSNCHPFFTGTQKFIDSAGRIEKFQRRYKKTKK